MNGHPAEELWIAEQRSRIAEYLEKENVDHLGVGEYPAFHVNPYFALWAVQSKAAPGSIGWWAVSGDVPADYISAKGLRHPRDAMRKVADEWKEVSTYMLRNEPHPDTRIGRAEDWPELGKLLLSRSEILCEWADNEEIWRE
jgi:hypothetical protein